MSTSYSQAQLDAMAQALKSRFPPLVAPEMLPKVARLKTFALFGNGAGIAMRCRMDNNAVRNFMFNPVVARYLAYSVVDISTTALKALQMDASEPEVIAAGALHPDPRMGAQWARELKQERVKAPDLAALASAPKVLSLNGIASLEVFAFSLAMETGGLVHLKMTPLAAWQISRGITEIALQAVWWDDLDNLIPGQELN